MAKAKYPFPVFGTQGGGLVRECGEGYVFVEAPEDFPSLKAGYQMPQEWGIIPANDSARTEFEGIDNFFEALFDQMEAGALSSAEAKRFFPEEVRGRCSAIASSSLQILY